VSEQQDIAALAVSLFDTEVVVAVTDIANNDGSLFPQERPAMARATDARIREFTAGRTAARMAMRKLGLPGAAVIMGPDRAPVWPTGIVGSISHSGTTCLAVLARSSRVQALGIDIEPKEPLAKNLWDIVCTTRELDWLENQPLDQQGVLAKLIFCAKESAYKCQYPLSRKMIDFFAFETTFKMCEKQFMATFTQDTGPFRSGDRLEGHFDLGTNLIMAAMARSNQRNTTFRN